VQVSPPDLVAWQGGFCLPLPPPAIPDLSSAAIAILTQSPTAESGQLVSYFAGAFTLQFWSAGSPVPLLVEILPPEQVRKIRDQVVDQLHNGASGLDAVPLRAFAEAARLYLQPEASERFAAAQFGAITAPSPGELAGQLSWPSGVAGTVLGSGQKISAQSHLAAVPAMNPAPLRQADLTSLILALGQALATQPLDPLWQQMLSLAENALA